MPPSMRRMWHGPITSEVVRLAGFEHAVPQRHAVLRRVPQVDLVADLARVAGARDDDLHPVELRLHQAVVGDVEDLVAEQLDEDLLRVRALDLHGRDVDLLHRDVHPLRRGDPERVEVHVGVGEREPELVLLDAEQDRVVQDPAVGAGDEHVLALVHRALVEVAGHDHVREVERVRTLDLDLLLDADVPQRHRVHEVPVLRHRIAVVARVVRVVVDAVAGHAVLARGVEVRRLADPRVEQDARVLVHGHRSVPLFSSSS